MKRLLVGLAVVALIGGAVAWSNSKSSAPEFDFQLEQRNPVSHTKFNNQADDFQFAIISDRTGGHRARVFGRAVEQINLLQPEFVLSVGDLIEGYTDDKDRLHKEWLEFQQYTARLQMPFFYVPGNHDISNLTMDKLWQEKFGRRYYEFVYKNVLFLMLNSEDPTGKSEGQISGDQIEFVKKTLEANKEVRWTLVFLHKPMWAASTVEKNGWLDVEKLLGGRPYTVFAGHVHRYQKFVRQGQNYYQLATTGGDSKIRGLEYGEFDHIVWVTMKKEGPVLANVMLNGVLQENLTPIVSAEEGAPHHYRRPTHPAKGTITFQGKPLSNAYVVFQGIGKEPRQPRADAFTDGDGRFILSTYEANDGAPAGDYAATVVWRKPFYDETGKPGKNLLPEKYSKADTSGLKATLKAGKNDLTFHLTAN